MKTKEYKTLKGLVRQTMYNQISFNDFQAGQFYHKTLGQVRFRLAEEERARAYELFAAAIYSNGKKNAYRLAKYNGKRYGILERLTILCKYSLFKGDYCAGQDWIGEVRMIQNIIRKG